MRAVQLLGKGDIRFAEVPWPAAPGPGEVMVRIEAAGICGSDIHNFRTGQWISRSPSIPGHEFSGRVERVGDGVSRLKQGDRVVADSRYWCGECPSCRAGETHLCAKLGFVGEVCDGGFAQMAVLPERLLLKADESIAAGVAAAAEPLAVALHAVKRLSVEQGKPVLVTGCGMIGALSALLLSRTNPVRVADRNAARAGLVAEVAGATLATLDAEGLANVAGVIEATGSTAVLDVLVRQSPGGARIALVGIFHGTIALDPTLLVERELSLLGCHAYRDELPEAVALLPKLASGIAAFLGAPITLKDVPDAYRRIIAGEVSSPKTVIVP